MADVGSAFSSGLLAGYGFVDNIFQRRRQLALQEREMARQEEADARTRTLFGQQQQDRVENQAREFESRGAMAYNAAAAKFGDDESKWDPTERSRVEGFFQQADQLRGKTARPLAGGALASVAGQASPELAAQFRQQRIGRENMGAMRTLVEPGPGVTESLGTPAARGLRTVAAQAPGGAVAQPPAPSGSVTQSPGARPPAPQNLQVEVSSGAPAAPPTSLAAAQASADANKTTLGSLARDYIAADRAMTQRAGEAVAGINKARLSAKWRAVADVKNQDPALSNYRREPEKYSDEYWAERGNLPRDVQQQLDTHFLPVASKRISAVREEVAQLKAQLDALPKQGEGVYDNAAQRSARRSIPKQLREREALMRTYQGQLQDVAAKFSVSKAVGASGDVPAGDALVQAAGQVTMPRAGDTPVPRLRADVRTLTETSPPNTKVPMAPQGAAVRAGMVAPERSSDGLARGPTISQEKLDAAGRLYMNGALPAEKYMHFLKYGTLDDVRTVEELKGWDPYKAHAVYENGKLVNIYQPKTPPVARGGMTAKQALDMVIRQVSARDKARAANAKENQRYVESLSGSVARRLSGDEKNRIGADEVSTAFYDFVTDFAPQFKQAGVDTSDALAGLSRDQVAELFGAYSNWYQAADEREQRSWVTRMFTPKPDRAAAAAGVQGKAAPVSREEWEQMTMARMQVSNLNDFSDEERQQAYEEYVAETETEAE